MAMGNQIKKRVRAAAVVVQNKALLLVLHYKEADQYYLLPGGGVKKGETEKAALVREMREETGLSAEPQNLLFETRSIRPDGLRHIIQRVYYCRVSGSIKPSQDPRVVRAEFVTRERFQTVRFFPNIKSALLTAWDKGFEQSSFLSLDVPWED